MAKRIILGILILVLMGSVARAQCGRQHVYRNNFRLRLDYYPQNMLISENENSSFLIKNKFGVGAELRLLDFTWLTFGYYPTAKVESAESFYGKNYQIGLKGNWFVINQLFFNPTAGVDFWKIKATDSNYKRISRGFLGLELELVFTRHLRLAGAGKIYYSKTRKGNGSWVGFIDRRISWDGEVIRIPKQSLNLSLILSF